MKTMKRVADAAKSAGPYFEYDNLKWHPFPGIYPDPDRKFQEIKEMKCRQSDVFLCAFPKCGTHWSWELICMLIKKSTKYDQINSPDFFIEANEKKDLFKQCDSPRLFNTHLPYQYLPTQLRNGVGKIVYVQRNPKDMYVSLYNFQKGKSEIVKQMTFEQFLERTVFKEEGRLGGWFNYTLEWEKHFKNENILIVNYEEMQQNLEREVLRIAKFLDIPCSEQFASEISEKCSFHNMRENKVDHTLLVNIKGDNTPLYRKGRVGDWKNWFTVSQNERFDIYYNEHMTDSRQTFVYDLTNKP